MATGSTGTAVSGSASAGAVAKCLRFFPARVPMERGCAEKSTQVVGAIKKGFSEKCNIAHNRSVSSWTTQLAGGGWLAHRACAVISRCVCGAAPIVGNGARWRWRIQPREQHQLIAVPL